MTLAPDTAISHSLHHGPSLIDAGPRCDDACDELDRDADVLALLAGFDDAGDEAAFWFVYLND